MERQAELERQRRSNQSVSVAHELKQPLAVACGYLELLLDDPSCDLGPLARGYVFEIQTSLRALEHAINSLQPASTV